MLKAQKSEESVAFFDVQATMGSPFASVDQSKLA